MASMNNINQRSQEVSTRSQQKSEKAILKGEQLEYQKAYLKATPEQKRNGKYFKELPIENMIDHEAIAYARKLGINDPVFKTGRMSNALL